MEIEITINKHTGKIELDAKNYKGKQCLLDMNELQKLLGANTLGQKEKQELLLSQNPQKMRAR